MNSRDDVLALLGGTRLDRLPVFGVLPSLTASGLKRAGVKYSEAHTNAAKMADAAASTFEVFGWESAVVPFDICVEAEALGCQVDFQNDVETFLAPTISQPIANLAKALARKPSQGFEGRIPLVADAIDRLKRKIGRDIAIGAWVPGPFTLAWQAFGAEAWLSQVGQMGTLDESPLLELAELLAHIGSFYRESGANFITVHEMGGSPQITGPERFRWLVKPTLQKLFARLERPSVLSICGDTNPIVRDLAECGASAINVDHRNELARTRRELPNAILLGNLDPVGLLSRGRAEEVRRAVEQIARAGVDAIVPGCDLYPDIPDDNMRALIETAKKSRQA